MGEDIEFTDLPSEDLSKERLSTAPNPGENKPALVYSQEEMQKVIDACRLLAEQRNQAMAMAQDLKADIDEFIGVQVELWKTLGLNEMFGKKKQSDLLMAGKITRALMKMLREENQQKVKEISKVSQRFFLKYASANESDVIDELKQLTDGRH